MGESTHSQSSKRICVYTPLNRLAIASGVPRHIIEVVDRLLAAPDLHVSFLANRQEATEYLPLRGPKWTSAARTEFEPSVASMARRWGIFNSPSFESLGGDADWLYLPADGYVAVQKTKLAVTIHDVYKLETPVPGENVWEHYKARLRHWVFYRQAARRASAILTVSNFSADRIMHFLKVPASRIHVVHNGVSPTFYSPPVDQWQNLRTAYGIEEDEPLFIYTGGLKAKKNGHGIIAAWSEFEKTSNRGKIVILGHHDPRMLQSAKGTLRRAIFPGKLTDEEVAVLFRKSTALFFPSLYEGFGIPIIEAFASKTNVIASDIPALREIANDVAYYVNPHDVKSMAEGLQFCLQNQHERADRIAAGTPIAAKFSWDNVAEKVRNALQ